MIFEDRKDAGQKLLPKLEQYKNDPNAVVLGLPRGGVVVASEVARGLGLPLDIVVPRKIGAPGNPEFAIGAITEDGQPVLSQEILASFNIEKSHIDAELQKERTEAARRVKNYRGKRLPLDLTGKTAIIVDDGIATGATMRAAVKSAQAKNAAKIVIAVPVLPEDFVRRTNEQGSAKSGINELIYLDAPAFFGAVGAFYREFPQTTDEEVIRLLTS